MLMLSYLRHCAFTDNSKEITVYNFASTFDNADHSSSPSDATIVKLMESNRFLAIPDEVYNWPVSYFHGHRHCTRYGMSSSSLLEISAGIIQGSGIGPASYVINSSDLTAVKPGNLLCKYADDTIPYHPIYQC